MEPIECINLIDEKKWKKVFNIKNIKNLYIYIYIIFIKNISSNLYDE